MKKVMTFILLLTSCNFTFNNSDEALEVAGTIRRGASGWYTLDNIDHQSIGISYIEETPTCLIMHYTFEAEKVISFTITPDETFLDYGIFAGVSVGLNKVTIYIYEIQSGNFVLINPSTINLPLGNFWFSGKFK